VSEDDLWNDAARNRFFEDRGWQQVYCKIVVKDENGPEMRWRGGYSQKAGGGLFIHWVGSSWRVALRWTPKTRQLAKVEPCP
jgi:hypothetical protein